MKPRVSVLAFVSRNFPALAIAALFAGAVAIVHGRRAAEAPPGVKTLRIGHWQLEAGVRDAFRELAAEYGRLHPDVRIVQDAIPESTYGQWMTTQLMGGTAPDMIQCGLGVPPHLMLQYFNRYMVPLSRYASQPNPHNKGTDLEGIPLQSTYKDGMINSYIPELQQYMLIPLSQFGVRIFYNRNLLRKLTGRESPPADFRAFLDVCRQIRSQADASGQPYTPISGSKYHIGMWESFMGDPLTFPLHRVADFNRDAFVGSDELYVAFKAGRLNFDHPAIVAKFRMLRAITEQFQPGFTGLGRDEAVFLFAQQRAVFITTGTWDARGLQEQAEGEFEVGVMDFPMPARDDSEFGAVIEGPIYERPSAGFAFAVTRTCKYPEVAADFLLFLASQRQNEKLNRIIGWIPAIRGADLDPLLRAFEPHLQGVYGCLNLYLGGETWLRWQQQFALFQVQRIDYAGLVASFQPFYLERGLTDFLEQQKDWRRALQGKEQFLAGLRARGMLGEGPARDMAWLRYRVAVSGGITPEIDHARQMQFVRGEIELPGQAPYEHSPETLARVRERLRAKRPRRRRARRPCRGSMALEGRAPASPRVLRLPSSSVHSLLRKEHHGSP